MGFYKSNFTEVLARMIVVFFHVLKIKMYTGVAAQYKQCKLNYKKKKTNALFFTVFVICVTGITKLLSLNVVNILYLVFYHKQHK